MWRSENEELKSCNRPETRLGQVNKANGLTRRDEEEERMLSSRYVKERREGVLGLSETGGNEGGGT